MVEHPIEVPPTQGSNPGCCIFAHLPLVVNESQADKEADAGEVLAPTSLRGGPLLKAKLVGPSFRANRFFLTICVYVCMKFKD